MQEIPNPSNPISVYQLLNRIIELELKVSALEAIHSKQQEQAHATLCRLNPSLYQPLD